MLDLHICADCVNLETSFRPNLIKITLPNKTLVELRVNADFDKIKDVKKLLSQQLGLICNSQFEIFEIKDKIKRLMHDDESSNKIYEEQKSVFNTLNPFKDEVIFLFTRHYYLSS